LRVRWEEESDPVLSIGMGAVQRWIELPAAMRTTIPTIAARTRRHIRSDRKAENRAASSARPAASKTEPSRVTKHAIAKPIMAKPEPSSPSRPRSVRTFRERSDDRTGISTHADVAARELARIDFANTPGSGALP